MARSVFTRRTPIALGKPRVNVWPTLPGNSSTVGKLPKPQLDDSHATRYRGILRMRICMVGCGAVGSLFAAHLARAGEAEIWVYDVWKEHTDTVRKNGLKLSGAEEFTVRLNATSDAKELPSCDYGIVATKAIHTRVAIAQTAHAFGDQSAVCSVQNGV